MKVVMSMGPRTVERTYGSLGSIVANMYRFIESGHDQDLLIQDFMNSEEVRARDYFNEDDKRYIVLPKRLPLDADVKGAYIPKRGADRNKPVVETAAVELKALDERLREALLYGTRLGKNTVESPEGRSLVKIYTKPLAFLGRHTKRSSLITVPSYAKRADADLAIRVFDLIYDNNAFEDDPELERQMDAVTGPNPAPKLELRQELQLKQMIEQEQQLAMKLKLQAKPLLIQQADIMQKSTQELIDMLTDEVQDIEDAQRAAAYVLRKRAIGRIKEAMPSISWKQATAVFNRMARKAV